MHLVPGRLDRAVLARGGEVVTHLAHTQEIGGSNPPCATIKGEHAYAFSCDFSVT